MLLAATSAEMDTAVTVGHQPMPRGAYQMEAWQGLPMYTRSATNIGSTTYNAAQLVSNT